MLVKLNNKRVHIFFIYIYILQFILFSVCSARCVTSTQRLPLRVWVSTDQRPRGWDTGLWRGGGISPLLHSKYQSTQLKPSSSCPNTFEVSWPPRFDWQCPCRRRRCCVHQMSGLSQTTVCQSTGCRAVRGERWWRAGVMRAAKRPG